MIAFYFINRKILKKLTLYIKEISELKKNKKEWENFKKTSLDLLKENEELKCMFIQVYEENKDLLINSFWG